MVGGKLPIRNPVLCFISPHYIRYRYRVKKQRLRKTAILTYVGRGKVVQYSTAAVVVQCSDSAAFGYYTVRCGATSVVKMVLGSEFLTVLQRLQEPATSAWR